MLAPIQGHKFGQSGVTFQKMYLINPPYEVRIRANKIVEFTLRVYVIPGSHLLVLKAPKLWAMQASVEPYPIALRFREVTETI